MAMATDTAMATDMEINRNGTFRIHRQKEIIAWERCACRSF